MKTAHASIVIARPPYAVFDFMLDVSRAQLWRYLVTRVEYVDSGPPHQGSRTRFHFESGGKQYTQEVVIAELERPTRQTWVNDADGFRLAVRFTLHADEGGTRVTVDADTRGTRWSTKPLVMLVGRGHPERFANMLNRLKLAVESTCVPPLQQPFSPSLLRPSSRTAHH